MISLFGEKFKETGILQCVKVSNFAPLLAPCFIWLNGRGARVSALLSWSLDEKLHQLVEINNGCQILVEYNRSYKILDSSENKCSCKAIFIIPERTSERQNNFVLWEEFKKNSLYTEYPYIYLYHHTEKNKYPLIISSGFLNSSDWNLAGTEKLKITFSNMTDIKEIKNTFDFWPLAMKNKNGYNVMIQDDYGMVINADIYITNRILNSSLKFKVDTRLLTPCHIIHHQQETGEWWEYYFPNIYRICCSKIKLELVKDYYLVDKEQVKCYKPSRGFIMVSGEDAFLIQMLLYERNIYDFFN